MGRALILSDRLADHVADARVDGRRLKLRADQLAVVGRHDPLVLVGQDRTHLGRLVEVVEEARLHREDRYDRDPGARLFLIGRDGHGDKRRQAAPAAEADRIADRRPRDPREPWHRVDGDAPEVASAFLAEPCDEPAGGQVDFEQVRRAAAELLPQESGQRVRLR